MTDKKHKMIAFLMLFCFFFSSFAKADWDERREKRWAEREKKQEAIFAELGLSEEQQASLKENRKAHQAEKKIHREKMKDLKKKMSDEIMKDQYDIALLSNYMAQMKDLMNKKADMRFGHILKVREVLTTEQFIKFKELRDQDRKKSEGREALKKLRQ